MTCRIIVTNHLRSHHNIVIYTTSSDFFRTIASAWHDPSINKRYLERLPEILEHLSQTNLARFIGIWILFYRFLQT